MVAQLKKQATRKWVRLVMLSTQCSGNPILIVRLFTINHRDQIPIVLIYNHAGEIKPAYRDGFKKLGMRLISRSKFTRERFKMLIDQYVFQFNPSKKKRPATQLTPQNLRQQILEDIEVMTTLPTLPKVYDKILRLSQDPKSDLKEWIAAIKVDPMTCAAIFRHINSLNYGFDGEISAIEREISGGLTHPLAGEILARKWQLGDALCNAILHHHQPEIDNSFAFLIGLADAVAQSICPFPKTSRPPQMQQAVE
jgi:hypothetical protein